MKPLFESAAAAIYGVLLRLATPLYLLRLWRRGSVEPGYREAIGERLAWYRGPAPAPGAMWLHAVSLGETRAAMPLLQALRVARPGLRLLLTHGTATGRSAGRELLGPSDLQVWLPYDTPGAVRRFLRRFQPSVGVLMETELWPNLMREAERSGLTMVLANARLSERSARKGRRLRALLYPAARRLTVALAQTEDDAKRLAEAGVPLITVSGNLKFDSTPAPELMALGQRWRGMLDRAVVLAASTREGEEAPLLAAWSAQPAPRPLLLLVPRHPQRFEQVAALIRAQGLTLCCRSDWAEMPPASAGDADVWLGNSIGEMPAYYACADVALLGGSFAPLGGQNLIEAAACGCPVVMGPHTFNFAQAAKQALAVRAAIRVASIDDAVAVGVGLAQNPDRGAWVRRALGFAGAHRGAAALVTKQVLEHIRPAVAR